MAYGVWNGVGHDGGGCRGWMEGVFGGMGGEKIFAMSKKKRYFANSLAHTIYNM